ncbi:MAG: AMP-binding protein, partial [bacterium]|nr:AMP-binding protein [bacterium]
RQYAVGNEKIKDNKRVKEQLPQIGAVPDVEGIHESPLSTPSTSSIPSTNKAPLQEPQSQQAAAVTYRELDDKSNRLAHQLQSKGVKPGTIVALMVERSIEMITGLLAILKTGAAYLPIDPSYPKERINYMLKDSNAKILLTGIKEIGELNELHELYELDELNELTEFKEFGEEIELMDIYSIYKPLDEPRPLTQATTPSYRLPPTASNLIYIIYTSGSTGKPKGVMLEHRNLVNLINYQYRYTNIDFSRVLQFTTIGFDVAAQEIFSTLLWGGRLSLVARETLNDIPALFQLIKRDGIKTLFFPASFLMFTMNDEDFVRQIPPGVKHIVTAGEQVVVNDRFRQYLQREQVYLHNHYGPSETHVVTTLTLEPSKEIPVLPGIGKPVANTQIYILDKGQNLLPQNIAGELYIGGAAVGRGYLNNPELTAERFANFKLQTTNYKQITKDKTQITNKEQKTKNEKAIKEKITAKNKYT